MVEFLHEVYDRDIKPIGFIGLDENNVAQVRFYI